MLLARHETSTTIIEPSMLHGSNNDKRTVANLYIFKWQMVVCEKPLKHMVPYVKKRISGSYQSGNIIVCSTKVSKQSAILELCPV